MAPPCGSARHIVPRPDSFTFPSAKPARPISSVKPTTNRQPFRRRRTARATLRRCVGRRPGAGLGERQNGLGVQAQFAALDRRAFHGRRTCPQRRHRGKFLRAGCEDGASRCGISRPAVPSPPIQSRSPSATSSTLPSPPTACCTSSAFSRSPSQPGRRKARPAVPP